VNPEQTAIFRVFFGSVAERQQVKGKLMESREVATHQDIEEGDRFLLDFDKLVKVGQCGHPLVPVAVQDADSRELLLIAYVNREALDHALAQKVATFWSTSRNELWIKGATSGDFLDLVEVRVNCEQNSLLYLVRPRGVGACHTKTAVGTTRAGCFYRKLVDQHLQLI
jgi:phosphoribosyl-AMP cyclohydrolase